MAELNRFADSATLSLAAFALVLAACSGESNGGPDMNGQPPPAGNVVGSGGATAAPGGNSTGAVGVTAPAAGASGVAPSGSGGVTVAPAGMGGTPAVSTGSGGTTAPTTGGGGVPSTAGAAGASTSTAGASGNGNGTVNGTPNDSWNVMSNLDANGLLIKPAADQGFQVQTPTFQLDPGQEVFKCFHTALPTGAGEFDVGDWESQMAPGSHHFILYKTDSDFAAPGQFDSFGCTVGPTGGSWIYSAAVPHTHLTMPDGVAIPIAANQKVQFDMHYINLGSDALQAHVTLNATKVKAAQFQRAQSQVSFNTAINIPPNGMQTVGGDCPPAANANYFMMLTHTHRRGIDASIKRKLADGSLGETLVHTTNWDSPDNILWENPPYLTFKAGEKFHYQCVYKNDRPTATTVGVSAQNNEMCMAITYFFPASTPPQCSSDVE